MRSPKALTISRTAAKTHASRALTKTGARDRAQLVVLAFLREGDTAWR